MPRLDLRGGLAGAADVFKSLLSSQNQIYENEELRRIRQEKMDMENKLNEARLARDAAAIERYSYLAKKAARDETVAAEKEKQAQSDRAMREGAGQFYAQQLGIPSEGIAPGMETGLQRTYLQQKFPAPLKGMMTANEKINQAKSLRAQKLAPLLAARKAAAAALGFDDGIIPTGELARAYDAAIKDPSKLGDYAAYVKANEDVRKILDDPNGLQRFLDEVRQYNEQPLDEEIEDTENYIDEETSATENPNAARIRALEQLIDSNKATETDINEYENLVTGQ